MNPKSISLSVLLPVLVVTGHVLAAAGRVEQLDNYQQQGVEQTDTARGRQLWFATDGERSCTSCHGETPTVAGKHAKTGKVIEPMAPSVNPGRFQSTKKIEKWFLRNCKWTFGRECSAQEKADILTWLASQ
ncbi:MAG: DUF1924 domain-containing protein [Gammaproteobacteria bacterium]|nr:MAG: DUF1924 domain-containing protein [Gammaproteobacteria bacterium]UCH39371.1 MAG: DUF1924 domain-containing protein [Gammaproteobacteria bacterium]